MTLTQIETDARTLAAYAVNLARGTAFEPDEFTHLAEVAKRYGMMMGDGAAESWHRIQADRAKITALYDEMWHENVTLRHAMKPWWKRLLG